MIYWVYILIVLIGLLFILSIWRLYQTTQNLQNRVSFLDREHQTETMLDRQVMGIRFLHNKGTLTNDEYQALTGVSDSTATLDLDKLEKLGFIKQIGKTGRGVHYIPAERIKK